jgi:hypothetical protein
MASKLLKQLKQKDYSQHCRNAMTAVYPWFNIDTREPFGGTAST